jgi:hypothetical protein
MADKSSTIKPIMTETRKPFPQMTRGIFTEFSDERLEKPLNALSILSFDD